MAVGRQALIERREDLGMSQERLAQELGTSLRTIRRLEDGKSNLRLGLRPRLAEVLKVSPRQLRAWLYELTPPNGHVVPPWLGHLGSLEQGAAEIQAWEPVVIHGLLQTESYAASVEQVGGFDDEDVAEKVAVRLARQRVLDRMPDPLQLSVILDESTLLRTAGGNETMADQLDHLTKLAETPNVTIQVMPLGPDVFPAAFGAFTILTSPDMDDPYMAFVEDGSGPHYLDRHADIERHVSVFDHLAARALPGPASIDLIHRTCKERYQ